jgi:cysteinyl-tRNA synthetase
MEKLVVYNTLGRKKELFKPVNSPSVGMYVCGPTVYGDAHIGHARPAVTFDLIFRYLKHLGYKVRYVRNITDVGHLEGGADTGEDKIAKKARLEQLEPMEIAQYYSYRFRINMDQLNTLPPSIEPLASGHIIEQIELVKKIFDAGFAYIVNGSVYFDVEKYNKVYHYGKLSGRNLDELRANTRTLQMQSEKKHNFDFALWKKAQPEHIMHWTSPWSEGFPGWHIECSAMSTKYLGKFFDIHGGGIDLIFPHHECEIAQSQSANKIEPVKYWIHNNMITINGQKMSKSLNNFITLNDLFSGKNESLDKAYNPMTVRFFILQAHYRSPLDFSNQALQAAEKGIEKLFKGIDTLQKITPSAISDFDVKIFKQKCYDALNDDFNSPILIATLFDGIKFINSAKQGKGKLTGEDICLLKEIYNGFVFDILGLKKEENKNNEKFDDVMKIILELRDNARKNKDWSTSDKIRDQLLKLNIDIKDTKQGATWELEK